MPSGLNGRSVHGSISTPAPSPSKPPGDEAGGLWDRLFGDGAPDVPALCVVDNFTEVPEPLAGVFEARLADGGAVPLASPVLRSRNWSGAWLTPTRGRRFVSVWGAWTVPESRVDWSPPELNGAPDAARCSHWIGIGGHRRHSLSVPQVGTMAAITRDGKPDYYAWFQWGEPTHSYGPLRITNFPVGAGHSIVAAVTVQARDTVGLYIRNEKTGDLRSIQWQAQPSKPVAVDGKSAEWIVERPSWFDDDGRPHLFPLTPLAQPDEPVCFEQRCAVAAHEPGEPGTVRGLAGARLIRMVGRRRNGPGSRFLAVPKKRVDKALTVVVRGD